MSLSAKTERSYAEVSDEDYRSSVHLAGGIYYLKKKGKKRWSGKPKGKNETITKHRNNFLCLTTVNLIYCMRIYIDTHAYGCRRVLFILLSQLLLSCLFCFFYIAQHFFIFHSFAGILIALVPKKKRLHFHVCPFFFTSMKTLRARARFNMWPA